MDKKWQSISFYRFCTQLTESCWYALFKSTAFGIWHLNDKQNYQKITPLLEKQLMTFNVTEIQQTTRGNAWLQCAISVFNVLQSLIDQISGCWRLTVGIIIVVNLVNQNKQNTNKYQVQTSAWMKCRNCYLKNENSVTLV